MHIFFAAVEDVPGATAWHPQPMIPITHTWIPNFYHGPFNATHYNLQEVADVAVDKGASAGDGKDTKK